MADTHQFTSLEEENAELRRQVAELMELRAADASAAAKRDQRLRLLEAVLEMVPVGVVLSDENGRIYHGNSRVEEMVGHPVLYSEDDESYGEWVSFHADGKQTESHEYPLARALAGEEDPELTVHYRRGDGSMFWMRIIGHALRDADDRVVGAAVALVDVDEEYKLQEDQQILIKELNHRVKNAFAVVKSIVSQSLRGQDLPDGLRQTIDDRLNAYARAHSKLVGSKWNFAPVRSVAEEILPDICGDRITIEGPDCELPSEQALSLSMAFYELATNATKHGALSVPDGHIELSWQVEERDNNEKHLRLMWHERGGPPAVRPERRGFGSFIIGRAIAARTAGEVETDYTDQGFAWTLDMPLEALSEET
ncbi:sensor histidine kinase [Parvularcula lutaonensis]|uniref:histidine kinase n=1 Tax=Parvularcula lutaonensis TaxID=491923 RepID=A0ABV7MCC9_9PROT|nr:HWE histidine kinase domain-containing protein [Parvularcula lutaonensis]GGY40909.1 hypothetical protein GCM10007148_06850 [Parvularcula lutaonensis]